MNPDIFGSCSIDQYCNNVRCTRDDTAVTAFQLSVITVYPCSTYPTVRVFFADSELQAQINVTVNKTTNDIPFHTQDLGTLNITMEFDSAKTSFNLAVSQKLVLLGYAWC